MTAAFRIEFELARNQEWTWRDQARNNTIVGAASETFTRFQAAVDNRLLTLPGYRYDPTRGMVNDTLPPGNPNRVIPVLVAEGKCPRCGVHRQGVPKHNPHGITCTTCAQTAADLAAELREC